MMKKRLSKKIWYGSDVDSEGKPVLPPLAKDSEDLEGLHYGELYLHIADDKLSLWTRTLTDQIKQIGGEGSGGELWKLMETESGEKYIFSAFDVATQKDFVSFADGKMVDLPTLYDGLPIDGQTIKWEKIKDEDGNEVERLVAVGGGGTAEKVTWDNIEGKPDFSIYATEDYVTSKGYLTKRDISVLRFEIGDETVWYDPSDPPMPNQITVSIPTKLSDLENDFDLKYLSVDGGELYGDLWMRSYSDNYGRRIIFGDKQEDGEPYVYLGEDEDDELTLFANNGIVIKVGDGSFLRYNKDNGYWELDGDLLVTGGITSYE